MPPRRAAAPLPPDAARAALHTQPDGGASPSNGRSPARVKSSYAKTLGRPDVRRAIAKHGTGALPLAASLVTRDDDDGGGVSYGFEALDLGRGAGGARHGQNGAASDASLSPRRRRPGGAAAARDAADARLEARSASPENAPATWAVGSVTDGLDRAWGSDASGALNSGSSVGDAPCFAPAPAYGGAEYALVDGGGASGADLSEEAIARRIAGLEQLTAAQRRALDAMASDRAALEHALGTAQLRFKAELDARRDAEAAAASAAAALEAERTRLEAARTAWAAARAAAEGAEGSATRLDALRAAREDATQELVAQIALAEDASHELESAPGRIAYECACEREALAAAHAVALADMERALVRTRAELAHAQSTQEWELERMRAAADATAGVAADALTSADARKRDLEGVNDALATLSERLYVGSLSIGALGAAAAEAAAAGEDSYGGGDGSNARRARAADTRDEEVAARQMGGRGAAAAAASTSGGFGAATGGNAAATAAAGAALVPIAAEAFAEAGMLHWGLAPPPQQARGPGGTQKLRRASPPPGGGGGGGGGTQRNGPSPTRRWAAANGVAVRPRGRAAPAAAR
jgi:hypothetical protein